MWKNPERDASPALPELIFTLGRTSVALITVGLRGIKESYKLLCE